MSDRCEPPEELRGVDGWHWVEAPAIQMCFVRRWWRARGQWCWADMDERTLRSFRYLAPVATPAEVDALRAEASEWCQKAQLFEDRFHNLRAEISRLRFVLADIEMCHVLGVSRAGSEAEQAALYARDQARAALEDRP